MSRNHRNGNNNILIIVGIIVIALALGFVLLFGNTSSNKQPPVGATMYTILLSETKDIEIGYLRFVAITDDGNIATLMLIGSSVHNVSKTGYFDINKYRIYFWSYDVNQKKAIIYVQNIT